MTFLDIELEVKCPNCDHINNFHLSNVEDFVTLQSCADCHVYFLLNIKSVEVEAEAKEIKVNGSYLTTKDLEE